MNNLSIAEFGDSILRKKTETIKPSEITGNEIQALIKTMQDLLKTKKLGVGLAAPQVGKGIALAVIRVRPMKHRTEVSPLDLVIINPQITEQVGKRKQLYEGCISAGAGKAGLFALVPRYKKIRLRYYNEKGNLREDYFEGLAAHVIQHEVDHLNGVLFVDKVKNTTSYKTHKEYLKYIKTKPKVN